MASTNLNNPRRNSLLLAAAPFLILLLGAAVLMFKWDSIPDSWAVHWGAADRPDRFATKTFSAVFFPLGFGLAMCLFLEAIGWIVEARAERGRPATLPRETAIAVADLTRELLRFIEIAMAVVFVFLGLLLPLAQPARSLRIVLVVFVVIAVTISCALFRLRSRLLELKRTGYAGLEGYNGIIYKNADDSRLWVPKLSGIGYTLNFAHPWAWPTLLSFVAIPIVIVLIVLISMAH